MDWVKEAYEAFVKNAEGIDPTDPAKAIQAHFDRTASDALKARAAAEGRTAKDCWKFVFEVARMALHGHSGHIAPETVYAIAMHWYEDVPVDWAKKEKPAAKDASEAPAKTDAAPAPSSGEAQAPAQAEPVPALDPTPKPGETAAAYMKRAGAASAETSSQPADAPAAPRAKARPRGARARTKATSQGFFFDLLESGGEPGQRGAASVG